MKLITSPHAKKALERLLTLGIGEYLFGDYRPSDALIGILHRIDSEPADRLGALLFECDIDKARRILRDLKFSNALVRDTLTVISGRDVSLPETEADARRFIARFGEHSRTVAYLHAFLGGKDVSALLMKVMREGFCSSIAELAINGSDLMALGYSGKEIGKTLEALFEIVLEKPEMNEKESLIKEALRLKGEINA
jgi:tRNA nucleotidyltransferase (CCA-adding enzyme)